MNRLRRIGIIAALAIPLPIAALPLGAILVYSGPTTEPGETILVTDTRSAPAETVVSDTPAGFDFAVDDESVATSLDASKSDCPGAEGETATQS